LGLEAFLMPQAKIEKPAIATYSDHEVITPPNRLRRAVSTVAATDPADDPVARAEAALANLSNEFSTWMEDECARLDAARRDVKARGFSKATHQALFHAAHDIKGDAATLGYPAVAAPADSLCRLLEHTPDMTRIPLTLVDQHVDAVRAIIRESARPGSADMAEELTKRLREVTEEFLTRENSDRPDYLDGILAPPLAPEPAG
jgi:HPt (histidine-containing phosphotransfer) domain-containing protein